MKKTYNFWVVTDLDGTLLDDKYDLTPALSTINYLKQISVPVIPCTSKTATEVRAFRKKYNFSDPFIVENGAAIYGNDDNDLNEWEIVLGRSYQELRDILFKISDDIGYLLKPLNDLDKSEIINLTGLPSESVGGALDRHWSVPFLNPPERYTDRILELSELYNVKVFKGNRMSHLLCKNSDKGLAVLALKKHLNKNNVKVVALGDSPNDLPLLEIADISVVVPGKNGPNKFFSDRISNGEFILAKGANSLGWSNAISQILNS